MAGSRWYWRTTPLSTGNALLQAVDIEVSRHEDFSSVIQSRRAWFSAVEANSEKDLRWFHVTGNAGGNCHFASLALMALQVTNGVTRVNSAVAGHDQKLNLMQQTMSF